MPSPTQTVSPQWIAEHVPGTGTAEIRDSFVSLIDTGSLSPGSRLPTIRDIADAIGTSTAAVTDAWGHLRRDGYIETRRRGGTIVAANLPRGAVGEGARHPGSAVSQIDPSLLPPIGPALLASLDPSRPLAGIASITPALQRVVLRAHPAPDSTATALPNALLATRLALEVALEDAPDDALRAIAVESPTLLRTARAVSAIAAPIEPVASDEEGPLPQDLIRALDAGARTFIYQPSLGIPRGNRLTEERAAELARIILARDEHVWVIEEDPLGPLAGDEGLGALLPEHTVRLRQYWRAFGPDLELTVAVGAPRFIERLQSVQRARSLRASPLLQNAVAHLLNDDEALAQVARAAETYSRRGASLRAALRRHGVRAAAADGLFVWFAVDDEAGAVGRLSDIGVHATPGSRNTIGTTTSAHVRIAVAQLPDDEDATAQIAREIAAVIDDDAATEDG